MFGNELPYTLLGPWRFGLISHSTETVFLMLSIISWPQTQKAIALPSFFTNLSQLKTMNNTSSWNPFSAGFPHVSNHLVPDSFSASSFFLNVGVPQGLKPGFSSLWALILKPHVFSFKHHYIHLHTQISPLLINLLSSNYPSPMAIWTFLPGLSCSFFKCDMLQMYLLFSPQHLLPYVPLATKHLPSILQLLWVKILVIFASPHPPPH